MTSSNPQQIPTRAVRRANSSNTSTASPSSAHCRLASMGPCLPPPPKGRTLVLGAGKAGGSMAQAVEALWPADAPLSGLVVTRYDHIPPRPDGSRSASRWSRPRIPVPDAAGLQAAERILALAQGLTADDLVLCLISGGGSALLTCRPRA